MTVMASQAALAVNLPDAARPQPGGDRREASAGEAGGTALPGLTSCLTPAEHPYQPGRHTRIVMMEATGCPLRCMPLRRYLDRTYADLNGGIR